MQTATLAVLILGWLLLGAAMLKGARAVGSPVAQAERSSRWAVLVQAIGIGLVWTFRRPVGAPFVAFAGVGAVPLFVVVALVAIGSGLLAVVAIATLGAQWSLTAQLRKEHTLITTGPYAFVRHPIYTALLGLLVATGLALSVWPVLAVATVVYGLGTMWRVQLEEQLLRARCGAEFAQYASRVPAFLPRPWSGGRQAA